MKRFSFSVRDTRYSINSEIASFLEELHQKDDRSPVDSFFLEKMRGLYSVYRRKSNTVVAYRDGSQFVSMDIQLVIDPPSIRYCSQLRCESNDVFATFKIPITASEGCDRECHEFIHWYTQQYMNFFCNTVKNELGYRHIQASNKRPDWELKDDYLQLDLQFRVVFK